MLRYLFDKPSARDLRDGHILALLDWLAPVQTNGVYSINDFAKQEMERVVTQALKDAGQQSLI